MVAHMANDRQVFTSHHKVGGSQVNRLAAPKPVGALKGAVTS
jgi:hypothetical protein